MRLAMVGPFGFHPNKSMRSRALPLAQALTDRGWQVKLLMPPWQTPEQAGRKWQEDGVEIEYVGLGGGVPGTTTRLIRETLAWQPQVVHTFKPKAYSGLVAWWLWTFRRGGLRLVTDSDDWEGWGGWNDRAPYNWWQKRFFAWQERWGLGHCHALTVASRTLQSLAWASGVDPQRVHYLPNGPGVPSGSAPGPAKRAELGLAGRPVLLLYSRLFEFDTGRLVTILQRVKAAVPELAVLAIGLSLYEDDAAAFRQQLAGAGLQDLVVDLGWVREAELPSFLAAADVGLYLMDDDLLNRTKCPVKLADMLSVGLPIVAEAVGQVPEYVFQEKTGLLRPSGDVEGLASDLVSVLQEETLRRRLAAGAQEHIATYFAWPRLAEAAERAYGVA